MLHANLTMNVIELAGFGCYSYVMVNVIVVFAEPGDTDDPVW